MIDRNFPAIFPRHLGTEDWQCGRGNLGTCSDGVKCNNEKRRKKIKFRLRLACSSFVPQRHWRLLCTKGTMLRGVPSSARLHWFQWSQRGMRNMAGKIVRRQERPSPTRLSRQLRNKKQRCDDLSKTSTREVPPRGSTQEGCLNVAVGSHGIPIPKRKEDTTRSKKLMKARWIEVSRGLEAYLRDCVTVTFARPHAIPPSPARMRHVTGGTERSGGHTTK